MNPYTKFILIFLAGELIALGIFKLIRSKLAPDKSTDKTAILIGLLERLVLFFGISINVTQVLIMFGALKIGSMFPNKKDNRKSLDYFLIGNLTSVLLALLYFFSYRLWCGYTVFF
jgi:hypothetical protein